MRPEQQERGRNETVFCIEHSIMQPKARAEPWVSARDRKRCDSSAASRLQPKPNGQLKLVGVRYPTLASQDQREAKPGDGEEKVLPFFIKEKVLPALIWIAFALHAGGKKRRNRTSCPWPACERRLEQGGVRFVSLA